MITDDDIKILHKHPLIQSIDDDIHAQAVEIAVSGNGKLDEDSLSLAAIAYELVSFEFYCLDYNSTALIENPVKKEICKHGKAAAYIAFGLYINLPIPVEIEDKISHSMTVIGLAYYSNRLSDLHLWIDKINIGSSAPSLEEDLFDKIILHKIHEFLLCYFRNEGQEEFEQLDKIEDEIIDNLLDGQIITKSSLDRYKETYKHKARMRLSAICDLLNIMRKMSYFNLLYYDKGEEKKDIDDSFKKASRHLELFGSPGIGISLPWIQIAFHEMTKVKNNEKP